MTLPWLSPQQFSVERFRGTYDYIMALCALLFGYLHAVLLLAAANLPAWAQLRTIPPTGKRTTLDGGAVAYDTPYAVRQHEDTRLRHDPGRRAKWLERTAQEQAPAIGRAIEQRLAQVTR